MGDVDSLRKMACDTLTKASEDGTLSKALSQAKNKDDVDVDTLRKMACDTLTKASEDGTLANALSAAKSGSGQAASSAETTLQPRSPVAQHLAVARNALLEAEKAAESSAADVAAEMEQ